MAQAFDIPPDRLTWEVAETALMADMPDALANLAQLGLKGYGLAMDDYGVGYSSRRQFARCPFTELKIDSSFVSEVACHPRRRAVLEQAIALARRLGIATVAEGVENRADWHLLRSIGCDMAQGYLLGKPMPPGELAGWYGARREPLRALCLPVVAAASPAALWFSPFGK